MRPIRKRSDVFDLRPTGSDIGKQVLGKRPGNFLPRDVAADEKSCRVYRSKIAFRKDRNRTEGTRDGGNAHFHLSRRSRERNRESKVRRGYWGVDYASKSIRERQGRERMKGKAKNCTNAVRLSLEKIFLWAATRIALASGEFVPGEKK